MSIKLPVGYFKKMVDSCKKATAKDDTRPGLKLINIDVVGNKLRMWAIDGYRVEIDEMIIEEEDNFSAAFENIYIPSHEEDVEIGLNDDKLEVTYYPSGLKMLIPQRNDYTRFGIDGFIKDQSNKDYTISFRKEFLEDALKKAKKKDKVIIKLNTQSNLSPVHIVYDYCGVKMESYVLPVRSC